MLKRILVVAVVATIAATISHGALAQNQNEGDAERGRVIAYTCFGCHGIPEQKNVYPTYPVPKIGGQTESYIVSALKAYRAGNRQHPTMRAQANTLSDQDINDIAAYFVSLHEGDDS
ncbi:c-type cytochrome [Wenzhouxiangella sediminis]|jgi:cytochrome c553|uniref:Cytochrome c n=1 Tax=Wenzhouxiangella sediminis TaxID=1792836 RepID=A0A3E1KCP7_9GAMM|nr:cytochrome c [Wenzhouxiangella sediminis]RFF32817.1 cytochrome c [Wenzhouxiangella sediminis]